MRQTKPCPHVDMNSNKELEQLTFMRKTSCAHGHTDLCNHYMWPLHAKHQLMQARPLPAMCDNLHIGCAMQITSILICSTAKLLALTPVQQST